MCLLDFFGTITDPRQASGKRYELKYILLFCVFAVLSGATGYATMAHWMESKKNMLLELFGLKWKKTPGKTCIQELFVSLSKSDVEESFRKFSISLAQGSSSDSSSDYYQIAIDGKSLRGSFDNVEDTSALNLISIFLTDRNLILAHLGIENKESEIIGVRELLEDQKLINELQNMGCKVITMDALHCQKKH